MQITALKTFSGKLGLIRSGETITVDDRYGTQLIAMRLAKLDVVTREIKSLGDAPENKGEGAGGGKVRMASTRRAGGGQQGDSSAGLPDGGQVKPLSSQPLVRRSRKRI